MSTVASLVSGRCRLEDSYKSRSTLETDPTRSLIFSFLPSADSVSCVSACLFAVNVSHLGVIQVNLLQCFLSIFVCFSFGIVLCGSVVMKQGNFGLFVCVACLLVATLVEGCTIEVLIKSHTSKNFFAQFTSPDGQKSPMWHFKNPTQNHRFEIKMDNCSKSPMVVETFEYDKLTGSKGKSLYSTRAFVNGNGFVDYTITSDLKPRMSGRVGVFCSFGDCGRGKRDVTRADRFH